MKKKMAKDFWNKLFVATSQNCCCSALNKKSETSVQTDKIEEQKLSINKQNQ